MKKLLAIVLAMLMAVSATACSSGSEQTNDNENSQSVENNNTPAVSNEISVENLMNYPTSPEEDFDWIDSDENGKYEVYGYLGDDEIVVIPETHEGKPIEGFYGQTFRNVPVKAVKLSDSIEIINESAFCFNETLELVVCGSGVKTIEQGAFLSSPNIKQIVLNDGLEKIGGGVFMSCDSLKSLEIPDSVTEIDPTAFYGMADDAVIIASEGSVAEDCAKENNINFQAK